jgi:uncharacterized peroxidase-related enzyme
MFIEGISKTEASDALKALYETAEETSGYIPNYLRLFSHRPDVYKAWQQLGTAIRGNLSLRRYELVTLAAARALGGTYCMLAHSDTLLNNGECDEAQLIAIARNYHHAGLNSDEVAIMAFAEKIIINATSVTQADVNHLKSFGLTDAEILDITLAATVRSFFSKTLDALNAEPDAKYLSLSDELREALSVGRPFGNAETV